MSITRTAVGTVILAGLLLAPVASATAAVAQVDKKFNVVVDGSKWTSVDGSKWTSAPDGKAK